MESDIFFLYKFRKSFEETKLLIYWNDIFFGRSDLLNIMQSGTQILFFCELKPLVKFRNSRINPFGRKATRSEEREKMEKNERNIALWPLCSACNAKGQLTAQHRCTKFWSELSACVSKPRMWHIYTWHYSFFLSLSPSLSVSKKELSRVTNFCTSS